MSTLHIDIETAIRKIGWATPQVGQKSLQRISVDFDARTVTSSFLTGKTQVLFVELSSARDSFKLVAPRFEASGHAFFRVTGQTASGVRFMPNIDYSFDFDVVPSEIRFSGTHDGYPSYSISNDGKFAYDYMQGSLSQLAGTSDIVVPTMVFKV